MQLYTLFSTRKFFLDNLSGLYFYWHFNLRGKKLSSSKTKVAMCLTCLSSFKFLIWNKSMSEICSLFLPLSGLNLSISLEAQMHSVLRYTLSMRARVGRYFNLSDPLWFCVQVLLWCYRPNFNFTGVNLVVNDLSLIQFTRGFVLE